MPSSTLTQTMSFGSRSLTQEIPIVGDVDVAVIRSTPIPAAKTGTLTTRGSDTEGTLTLAAGHGVVTGDVADVYWSIGNVNYVRYSVTVGTVSGNSVPISSGGGDTLPPATTPLTVMKPVEESVSIVADDLVALGGYSQTPAVFTFRSSSDTIVGRVVIKPSENNSFIWASGASPLTAGTTVAKVQISHGDSSSPRRPEVYFRY
jgi:hypothetical protein